MINDVMQGHVIYLQSATMTAVMIQPVGVAFATRITDVANMVMLGKIGTHGTWE